MCVHHQSDTRLLCRVDESRHNRRVYDVAAAVRIKVSRQDFHMGVAWLTFWHHNQPKYCNKLITVIERNFTWIFENFYRIIYQLFQRSESFDRASKFGTRSRAHLMQRPVVSVVVKYYSIPIPA